MFREVRCLRFSSSSASDEEIPQIIKSVWDQHQYLVDPHTACAFKDLDPKRPCVILATAHPAKFPSVYEKAEMEVPKAEVLESLALIEPKKYQLSSDPESIRSFIKEQLRKRV